MATSKTPALPDICLLGKQCLCGSLSRRLRQVLHRFLEGKSEKQVGIALGISGHTVHVYTKDLYRRFNVAGRSELMALALRTTAAAIPPSRPRALRHNIGLSESQREDLLRFLADTGRVSNRRITQAKILIRLDGGRNDYDIADELNICVRTIERTRQSFLQTHPPPCLPRLRSPPNIAPGSSGDRVATTNESLLSLRGGRAMDFLRHRLKRPLAMFLTAGGGADGGAARSLP